jgi:hypothetical protein
VAGRHGGAAGSEGGRAVRHDGPVRRRLGLPGGAFQLGFNLHWTLSSLAFGEVERRLEVRIDLVATSNRFASGHRIRLEVSSSNFPRFDRNTNTGGTIARSRRRTSRSR